MSLLSPNSNLLASDRGLPAASRALPVVGWRNWRLRRDAEGVILASQFGSERWEVGPTHASCRNCPPWIPASYHPVPSVSCQCGLYAFSTAAEAIRRAQRQTAPVFAGCGHAPPVVGAVVAWGRVVEHGRQGWRAEYARPIALLNTGAPLLEEAGARYGVPLVSMRGLTLLPLEYGEPLTAAQRSRVPREGAIEMVDRLEISKSGFVEVLSDVMGGYACLEFFHPGDTRGLIPPDPESCKHFLDMIAVVTLSDAVIERAYNRQNAADTVAQPGSEAMRASNRSELDRFVDDLCGAPPKVTLMARPNVRFNADRLHPADILVAGARFRAAAEQLDGDSLRTELSATADRLFEIGLSRLDV